MYIYISNRDAVGIVGQQTVNDVWVCLDFVIENNYCLQDHKHLY